MSVGIRGTVALDARESGGHLHLSIVASTPDYPAFVDSLPLGLTQVRALGVTGPVSAKATIDGPTAFPPLWSVTAKLDLKESYAVQTAGKTNLITRLREGGLQDEAETVRKRLGKR